MKRIFSFFALIAIALGLQASEISVQLKLDEVDYVVGERVRGVVSIENQSPDRIRIGSPNSSDRFLVEVFLASDMSQIDRRAERPFVAAFELRSNESQRLELFLGDHYALTIPRRYLARPVLVHRGMRYEGQYRAFDIVPGMRSGDALQMFSNREGLERHFELLRWQRRGREHLFLSAYDGGTGAGRTWQTCDVGPMMRITRPTISILPSGVVIVLHRMGTDHFLRSEFWSMPDALEFVSRQQVQDPETAGQSKVQELYNDAGGVKPVDRPWWKFW